MDLANRAMLANPQGGKIAGPTNFPDDVGRATASDLIPSADTAWATNPTCCVAAAATRAQMVFGREQAIGDPTPYRPTVANSQQRK